MEQVTDKTPIRTVELCCLKSWREQKIVRFLKLLFWIVKAENRKHAVIHIYAIMLITVLSWGTQFFFAIILS